MLTKDDLQAIGELIDQKLEPVKQDMSTKQDISDVRQDISRTNTALNAVAAGQKELQETVATKADVIDVGAKVDKLKKRIEGLEETEGITHKN
jgi:hypothetical protein